MNILILEPTYSNFICDFAKSLKPTSIHSFIFNFGYIIYLKNTKKIYINKILKKQNFTDKDLDLAKKTNNLFTVLKTKNSTVTQKDFETMAKYISFLREYIKNKKINLVLMLNDLRWQHALSIEICKELDIKYIVFEQGYFRPNTITMDFKGVNANSSLCNINLKDIKYTKKEIRSYRLIFYKKYQTILKFSLFIFLNKIGKLCNLNVECQNKQYSFVSYFKNFISKNFIRNKKDDYNLPDKFIYVPLQVNTDTQILIHSDFCDMQEFIDVVENSFYSFNKKNDIKLVFNIHPMEKGTHKYKFDDKTIISNAPTRILIQKSLFVITINSTVGLESLIEHKNLIVLGNAFYKLKEICICSDKLNLENDMKKLICKDAHINFKLVDSFLDYIKYEYLVNGNFYNYDKNTLEECCAKYYSSMNI